ncbi:MAG: YaiI/YqxD family protein [Nitrospirae bacterium]|nr:YaiI/YqxD family protein [Nitrospirota bacterium]
MNIYVDADACPVKEIIYYEARDRGGHVVMVVSMAHAIGSMEGMDVVRVDSAFQAVDIAIANRADEGDIVVTSDYGLAALVLGKGAIALSPSGRLYSDHNIDTLLEKRHASHKQRKRGVRIKGPKARKKEDDESFRKTLVRLMTGSSEQK